jgi:hypothetical protein
VRVDPATTPRVGTISERLQSYNVEMAEVIGGTFWKPYDKDAAAILGRQKATTPAATPVGLDPALFERRPAVNLSDSRLRRLAPALGPAYVRVSGTWANAVYFHDSPGPTPSSARQASTAC